jgi:hypothetical protein
VIHVINVKCFSKNPPTTTPGAVVTCNVVSSTLHDGIKDSRNGMYTNIAAITDTSTTPTTTTTTT